MIYKIREFLKKILSEKMMERLKNIYKYFFHLMYPKGYFKKINFLDIKFYLKIDFYKNGGVDGSIFLKGVFEPEYLELFKNNLDTGNTFIDIGANIGHHSLFASKVVGDNGKVIAFEPLKDIYNQFQESINKNNFKNITLYNKGCGSKEEILTIYSTNKNIGGSSVIPSPDKRENGKIEIIVPDNILENEKRVDFIKIDVEGYELEVLKGLKNTIQKFHPKIFLEYSPYYYELKDENISREIVEFLLENNYRITDLENNNRDVNIDTLKIFEKENLRQSNFFCS